MHDDCYDCELMPTYNPPIIVFQEELYKLLSDKDELSFPTYDSGVPADDILAQFENLNDIKFAVISDVSCNQTHSKTDAIIWHIGVRLEFISTYRGRKKIAEMIQEVGNAVTRTEHAFGNNLFENGYALVRINIGEAVMGSSSHDGGIAWQNGYLIIDYWLSQIEQQ